MAAAMSNRELAALLALLRTTSLHLQVIHRHVGGLRSHSSVQRLLPQLWREVRQAGDEVQAPGGEGGGVHCLQCTKDVINTVGPATGIQQLLSGNRCHVMTIGRQVEATNDHLPLRMCTGESLMPITCGCTASVAQALPITAIVAGTGL